MQRLLFFFIFIFSLPTYGYIPTLESVLRNGVNKEFSDNFLKVKLDFHRFHESKESDEAIYTGSYFISYYLTPKGLITTGEHKNTYFKNFPKSWSAQSNDLEVEQRLFFAALEIIFLNRSLSMVEVLKVNFPDFLRNIEKVNSRKVAFLEKYKKIMEEMHKYHQARKPVPAGLNNQYNNIHRQRMLKQAAFYTNPQLEFKSIPHLGIFLESTLENITFLFHHQNHRLYRMDIPSASPKALFEFNQETITEYGYTRPKDIIFYQDGVKKWKISIPHIWVASQNNYQEKADKTLVTQELYSIFPELILAL